MALKITHQEVDGADLLALDGRLVGGEETRALREKVKTLLAEGKKNLVLDLSGVTMLDSTGLGALVTAHSSAKVGALPCGCAISGRDPSTCSRSPSCMRFSRYPTRPNNPAGLQSASSGLAVPDPPAFGGLEVLTFASLHSPQTQSPLWTQASSFHHVHWQRRLMCLIHSQNACVQILGDARSGGPVRVEVGPGSMVGLEGVEPPA